jgi:HD-GYP domain-containing protein (c-di-GMP phosphodiesterase class II)
LAGRLHVTPETTEDLRMGALMHEIGKIGIPETILYKPERLTDEEFALLRWYPVIGYEMCKPLGLREGVLMLIRNHAERLDGTGYPDGLRQGQLPLPVRIMSVADAYDAMSSTRAYRQAMTQRERTEQLNRFAGTQFDPIVVETLKDLVNEGELDELYRDRGDLALEAGLQDDNDGPFLKAA